MIVDVYAVRGTVGFSHKRAEHVARAMADGLERCGVQYNVYTTFDGRRRGDLAVAYGWIHADVFRAYGRYVYWDLGYWGRRPVTASHDGFHRLAFHDWDTAAHMARNCPIDRLEQSNLEIQPPPRVQSSIALVAGMSAKGAATHGYRGGDWERGAAAALGALGWRTTQRPKPSKRTGQLEPIEQALMNCGLLATHHSNCAVDAVIAGVPVWAVKGVGRLVSSLNCPTPADVRRLTDVERRSFLADLAYAQWTPSEMRTGAAWSFIEERLKCV